MQILIIGGTNFIGPPVIHHLQNMGHEVTVFHRGKTQAELPDGVSCIIGDRTRLHDFQSQFEQLSPQLVLDMICYTESDARMLMNVFKGITQRVIAVSSMDVYRAYEVFLNVKPDLEPVPLTEDSPLHSSLYLVRDLPIRPLNVPSDYEKIVVEKVVMAESELPGTIIRLPMVYGRNDPLNRLFPYLQRMDDNRPAIVLSAKMAQWCGSYGYVENIAYAIALTVTNERAKNRIYHVAESETLSEAQCITKIGEIVGWKGKVVTAELPLDGLPINPAQHWFVDSTRIRRELGYEEIVPLDEALQRTIAWQRNHPPNSPQPFTAPHLLDYDAEDRILNDLLG